MLYFYDNTGRYIGCRARIAEEPMPDCATETPVEVPDGHEAHFNGAVWAVTEIAPMPDAPEPELIGLDKLKFRTAANEDAISGIMDMMMGGLL